MIAALPGIEVLNKILYSVKMLVGKLLVLDGGKAVFRRITIKKRPGWRVCSRA